MTKIVPSNLLEEKLAAFSVSQRALIFNHTPFIQLTEDCSNGCVDCGLGAVAGVRDYIGFDKLEKLLTDNKKSFKNLGALYHASDPFDYNFDGKNYCDIDAMFTRIFKRHAFLTTGVPKGSEKIVVDKLLNGNSIIIDDSFYGPFISQLSIMKTNYPRLQKAFSEMEGFRVEDQIQTTEFKTGEDNLIVITDKSLRNKTDYHSYAYGEKTGQNLFIVKVKNEYICSQGDPVTFHDIILHLKYDYIRIKESRYGYLANPMLVYDFFTDELPEGQLHKLRLGEKFKDNLSEKSIACFQGVVLKPNGAFNVQPVKPSKEHPTGNIETEITPKNFEIIPFNYVGSQNYKQNKLFYNLGKRRMYGQNWLKDRISNNYTYWKVKSLFV